jgi:hypothetical protein
MFSAMCYKGGMALPALAAILLAAAAQVRIAGRPARAWASSAKDLARYAPTNAFDGDPATAWVEGAPGPGEGESLFLEFDQPVELSGFLLVAGYARSAETLLQNAVPGQVEILADGKPLLTLELAWVQALQPAKDGDGPGTCMLTPAPANLAPRLVVLSAPATTKSLQLRLSRVHRGSRFEDAAISEWQPLIAGVPTALGKASYQDARAALESLAKPGAERLAPGAQADAVFPWAKGQKGAEYRDYDALIQKRLGGARLPAPQAWLRAFSPELLDHAVVVLGRPGSRRLIGARSWSEGDGEWDELFPSLVLDAQGRIARLQNLFHSDGAPGCRRALPDP